MKKNIFYNVSLSSFAIMLSTQIVLCNNIQIDSEPAITGSDIINHCCEIRFDLSWENSWRTSSGASNYDAAWVFIKYQKQGQTTWNHAYLSTTNTDHSIVTDNGVPGEFKTGITNSKGMGVFIYRANDGIGNINWDSVKIKWNYGENGLLDADYVTIRVFAIEMVYIPQGLFYAGDGTAGTVHGQFSAHSTTNPFQITGEQALTLGGLTAGNLGNRNNIGMNTSDDFSTFTTQALPVGYPKGYNAFYSMKYEISQEQYVDFLNTLNGDQQFTRITAITVGRYMRDNNTSVIPQNRNGVKCKIAPNGSIAGEYGNDLNNNGIYNEPADGMNIACNWLSWGDGTAYADWAGLRPISEMEYEKASRGSVFPVADEFAWGSAAITQATGILNSGLPNETYSNAGANCAYNNNPVVNGPLRNGAFATSTSNRVQSGSSYYGVMELSGNLWERCICVGNATGRAFLGSHGDGTLSVSGNHANTDWPAATLATGAGFRGGNFYDQASYTRVSSRYFANGWGGFNVVRYHYFGFRCVRTAP